MAWLLGFGYVTVITLAHPIEEVLANVWILAFGLAGTATALPWRNGVSSSVSSAA